MSSLLYNGYRVFPGGKERPGRDADPSPPSSANGHERVELYLYSPYGPYGLYSASVPVQGWPLPLLTFTVHLDTIKVLLPIDAQNNCFKRILKFTLKQLQHVSALSPSSGSVQFELAKVTFVQTAH